MNKLVMANLESWQMQGLDAAFESILPPGTHPYFVLAEGGMRWNLHIRSNADVGMVQTIVAAWFSGYSAATRDSNKTWRRALGEFTEQRSRESQDRASEARIGAVKR